MIVILKKYEAPNNPALSDLVRAVKSDLIPMVKTIPGVKGYTLIDFGDGHIGSLSLFLHKGAVDAANEAARTWIQKHPTIEYKKPVNVSMWETL